MGKAVRFTLTTVFNDDTVAYAMENGWTPLPT